MSTDFDARITELGIELPAAPNLGLPFAFARRHGDLVYLSGHGPLAPDGSVAEPLGKLGAEVSIEQGHHAARLTAIAMMGSLKDLLGSLNGVVGWLRLFGMVNAAPDFARHPQVINGASEVILEVFGPEVGNHSRSAVGMGSLPFNMPVEIEGVVAIG